MADLAAPADRRAPRPPSRCPKCGAEHGFLHSEPEYRRDPDPTDPDTNIGGESLLWRCGVCRFAVATPTADAEEQR